MYTRVFPAVADVGLVHKYSDQSFAHEPAECLRGLFVVFVYFRKTVREFVVTIEDCVIKGQFARLLIGKELFHLPEERLTHAIGVVGEQKTAGAKILAENLQIVGAKIDVTVTSHIEQRIVE